MYIYYQRLGRRINLKANDLAEKLLKACGNPLASIYTNSSHSDKLNGCLHSDINILNVACSGKWDGGLCYGITIIAGPSRHYKTGLALNFLKSFQQQYDDGACIFLDSELGSGISYMENIGIDTDKVVHIPIADIEEAKFQTVKMLETLEENDKLFILYDSIGNTASKKELEDAKNEKSVADMTRARAIKSYFRIITPLINLKKVYFVGVNHTYQTMDFISKEVMSAGQGPLLSADTVFFMGRSQEKDTTGITGYNFKLKVHKSRFVKEGSVFPLNISFEEGVDKYSGLLDLAIEHGIITKPNKISYCRNGDENDKWSISKLDRNDEFWEPIVENEEFKKWVERKYRI